MAIHLKHRWAELHWATRLSALIVFAALLWWQSRYTWSVHNPMYGWPMPFDNLWYGESLRPELSLTILLLDCGVWVLLAGSAGFFLNRWRLAAYRLRPTLNATLAVVAVVAVILALGCAETYLRKHPNNGSMFPRYARVELGSIDVWFDIGLFTDPMYCWPLVRIVVVFAIGSGIYTVGTLLYRSVQCRCLVSETHKANLAASQSTFGTVARSSLVDDDRAGLSCRDPVVVRAAIWTLFVIIGFYFMVWLLCPKIY
jgi:hypothetical protein